MPESANDQHGRSFFEDRSFGQHLPFGDYPALIIVDMMCGFTDPSYELGSDLSHEIERIETVAAAARQEGVPVIHVYSSFSEAGLDSGVLWLRKQGGADALHEDGAAVEFDPRITVERGDRKLRKKYASAFFATDLVPQLNALGCDTVVLTGCTTSGCVRATAVDAVQYGYVPIVVADCVGDRDEAAHDQSLFDLEMKYADVVSSDTVCTYFETGSDPMGE